MLLHERTDPELPFHDPVGRDRAISCGAAVVHLELGIRALGADATVSILPEPARPHLIARAVMAGARRPGERERAWLAAVERRSSHRRPFLPADVPAHLVSELVRVAVAEGAAATPLHTQDARLQFFADNLDRYLVGRPLRGLVTPPISPESPVPTGEGVSSA